MRFMSLLKLPELLAPVGDRERLDAALLYGADAVYLGGKRFGMRASPQNFDDAALKQAVEDCHAKGVKVYLTLNTLPTPEEAVQLDEFMLEAYKAGVDALIVADIGVMMLAKRIVPDLKLHISTQMGVMNHITASELYHMGASRVVLARELDLEQIKIIRDNTPPELELEAFAHGAMCVSVSGRCLLSNYMTGRDANRGQCAQSCRWNYALMEEKRPGEYFQIFEDERGSFILNAQDMCMLPHIDKMVQAGISTLKIEGRAKSAYYVSSVTHAYRMALDHYNENPDNYNPPQWLLDEVEKVSHRPYSTGFFMGPEHKPTQTHNDVNYLRYWEVSASVDGWEDGMLLCTLRNRFFPGDSLEILIPGKPPETLETTVIYDENDKILDNINRPMMKLKIPCEHPVPAGSMLRRQISQPKE